MARAFLVGALFSLIVGFISPYTVMAIQPMGMSADFITAGALFFLLIIVGVLNPILKLLKNRIGFEFLLDVLLQFDARKLKNLNRLLHLLGQHETLRLRLREAMFHMHHWRKNSR